MNVLVLGDFILDTYIFGSIEKISPEAPVMEFLLNGKIEYKLGGAANVAWILDNLGVEGVFLTKTGPECASIEALGKYNLKYENIQYTPIQYGKTCQKIRLIDENYHQHILRLAIEDGELPFELFVENFRKPELINKVIFSDYQKGFLNSRNISYIRSKFQECPVIVAIKYQWDGYVAVDDLPDVTCVVGNHKEIAAAFSTPKEKVLENPVKYAAKVVVERGFKNCIITLGAKGAAYYSWKGTGKYIPTIEREIFDVTGAGDSFFAVVAYLWGNTEIEEIITKANQAAGLNVQSLGNTLIEKGLLGG